MTEEEWFRERNIFELFMFLHSRRYRRKWHLFCCTCLGRVSGILKDRTVLDYVGAMARSADGAMADDELERFWEACEEVFELRHSEFPYNGFAQAVTEHPMSFDPFDVAKACREAVGVVVAEALRPAPDAWTEDMGKEWRKAESLEEAEQHKLLDDIFGNPFRPAPFDPCWRTSTAVALARQMYESQDFSPMPILADALQDAGCENDNVLAHCRGEGPHVRGCWVVDLVLNKG